MTTTLIGTPDPPDDPYGRDQAWQAIHTERARRAAENVAAREAAMAANVDPDSVDAFANLNNINLVQLLCAWANWPTIGSEHPGVWEASKRPDDGLTYEQRLAKYLRLEVENLDMPDGYEDAVDAAEAKWQADYRPDGWRTA